MKIIIISLPVRKIRLKKYKMLDILTKWQYNKNAVEIFAILYYVTINHAFKKEKRVW